MSREEGPVKGIFWSTFRSKIRLYGLPFLTIILGDRGSGKTNLALVLAELGLKLFKLKPVLVLPAEIDSKVGKLQVKSLKWLKENLASLRDSTVILDEGLISLNAREWRKTIALQLVKLSAVGRHRKVHFIITSQAHRIDVQLREMADAVVVKKTYLSRLVLLDKSPKWIVKVDRALKRAYGLSIEDLNPSQAIRIGHPVTDLVERIPVSKWLEKLSTRAADHDISLRIGTRKNAFFLAQIASSTTQDDSCFARDRASDSLLRFRNDPPQDPRRHHF